MKSLATQMEAAGLPINMSDIPKAMAIPVVGLIRRIVNSDFHFVPKTERV